MTRLFGISGPSFKSFESTVVKIRDFNYPHYESSCDRLTAVEHSLRFRKFLLISEKNSRFFRGKWVNFPSIIFSSIIRLSHKLIESVIYLNVNSRAMIQCTVVSFVSQRQNMWSENLFSLFLFSFSELFLVSKQNSKQTVCLLQWDELLMKPFPTQFSNSLHMQRLLKSYEGKTFSCKCLFTEKGTRLKLGSGKLRISLWVLGKLWKTQVKGKLSVETQVFNLKTFLPL